MKKKLNRNVLHRDRAASERQLLVAAKKIFSTNGFTASTTRMISEKSGVNLALITRYFKTKYGLLEAVLERDLREKTSRHLSYPAADTLEEECLAFADYAFENQTSDIDFLRIILGQFLIDKKFLKKFRDKSFRVTDTDFEKRLTPHLSTLGIDERSEVLFFASIIENCVLASVLFNMIIKGQSRTLTHAGIRKFISNYCQMYVHHHTR